MTVYTKAVHIDVATTANPVHFDLHSRPATQPTKSLKQETFAPYNAETDIVLVDIERMETAINAKRFQLPRGLTREEKRQHILKSARENS